MKKGESKSIVGLLFRLIVNKKQIKIDGKTGRLSGGMNMLRKTQVKIKIKKRCITFPKASLLCLFDLLPV